jgi:MFS family permease
MIMHWSWLFFISVICVGMGHGLSLLGAFALVHHMTNIENRAAVVSTYLFIAYFGTIIPIITAGYLSDHLVLWSVSLDLLRCRLVVYLLIPQTFKDKI